MAEEEVKWRTFLLPPSGNINFMPEVDENHGREITEEEEARFDGEYSMVAWRPGEFQICPNSDETVTITYSSKLRGMAAAGLLNDVVAAETSPPTAYLRAIHKFWGELEE